MVEKTGPRYNISVDLKGKTAVVIGGTSGIGLTLSLGLARAGANVVPTGRRAELGLGFAVLAAGANPLDHRGEAAREIAPRRL